MMLASVFGYYAAKVGIKTVETGGKGITGLKAYGVSSEDEAAVTEGDNIFLNKYDNKINSKLDDANNLMSILEHEKIHKDNNQDREFHASISKHLDVYSKQMSSPTFANATTDFQNGIVTSFANYIMNAAAGSISGAENFASDFNKNNKQGFKLYVNTSSSDPEDFSTTIYRNHKLLGTAPYKVVANEH
jgi:hypothetical protein